MEFVQELISQKSVFPLPGKCFGVEDYFRIVITIPQEQISEAVKRISDFCRENTAEGRVLVLVNLVNFILVSTLTI